MGRTSYTREEVLAGARSLFNSLDFSDEAHLRRLGHRNAQADIRWYSSACRLFGSGAGDWSGALGKLLEADGIADAADIVEKIKRAGRNVGVAAVRSSKLKYQAEQVRERFRSLIEGVDFHEDARLAILGHKHAMHSYDWYPSACTIFGKGHNDWYGALERLLEETAGRAEARSVVERVKAAGKRKFSSAGAISRRKYSPEQVRAKFMELTGGMDLSDEKQLAKLGFNYAQRHYDWHSSAGTQLGSGQNDWFGALKALFAQRLGIEEAEKMVARIRDAVKADVRSRKKTKVPPEDVRREFARVTEGMDFSDNRPLAKLRLSNAASYPWFKSACTLFGKNSNDWYGAVEQLLVLEGKAGTDGSRAIVARVRDGGKNAIREAGRRKCKYTPDQVRKEFKAVIEAMDLADESQLARLTASFAEKKYGWHSSACTHFGKNHHDWYGALGTLLGEERGAEAAKVVGGRLRKIGVMAVLENGTRRLKFFPAEVRKEFKEATLGVDFSDPKQLQRLTYGFARKKYAWYSSACSCFSGNKRDWYDALQALLTETKGTEEAKMIVDATRAEGRKNLGQGSPVTRPRFASEQVKLEFKKIVDGMDISDETQLVRLGLAYAQSNYEWYSSARTLFGRNRADWYRAAERLLVEACGFSEDDSKRLIVSIRTENIKHGKAEQAKASLRYSEEMVRAEFRKALAEVDLTDDKQLIRLTYSYAALNHDWISSACTKFGKRYHDWYGALDALAGEVLGVQEAEALVIRVRAVGKEYARGQGSKSLRLILVQSQRLSNGKTVDFSPMVGLLVSSPGCAVDFKASERQVGRRLVLSTKGSLDPTGAQRLLFGLGRQDWESIARDYSANFSSMAPFIVHHMAVEYLIQLAKRGDIGWPESVLSQASGVSELYSAFTGMRPRIEAAGFRMPAITDLDTSAAMLAQGVNPRKIQADMRATPFPAGSFSMVENSSLYQFTDPAIIRDALIEASRVTKEGGTLILSSSRRPFGSSFHSALRGIGYETLGEPGKRIDLSGAFLESVTNALGADFCARLAERVRSWHLLVALKVRDTRDPGIEQEQFRLAKIPKRMDPLIMDIGRVSRVAFRSSSIEELDVGISAILELLAQMEMVDHKQSWKIFDRITRLESKKLAEFGMEEYDYDRGDLKAKAQEFLTLSRRRRARCSDTGAGIMDERKKRPK